MTDIDAALAAQRETLLNAALEYLDRGWSVIPINPDSKRPLVQWREFQERQATEEEVVGWFDSQPRIALGLVTGKVSGVVVVDADSAAGEAFAVENGLTSPFAARTGRGPHWYFKHPGHEVRNQAGMWNADDLDFRGDGGYVVVPPSICKSKTGQYIEYRWESPEGLDWDDDAPVYPDQKFASAPSLEVLIPDLTGISIEKETATCLAEEAVSRLGRKIAQGEAGGRDNLIIKHAGECVAAGVRGYPLRDSIRDFMETWFLDDDPRLDKESYVEEKARNAELADKRNHPERYEEKPVPVSSPLRPIFASDVARLEEMVGEQVYLIDPWLRAGSIVQIFAYSGAGKSRFVQTVMWHLAMGRTLGGFDVDRPARVLYLDYENGMSTVAERMRLLLESYGDPGQNLGLWSPAVLSEEEGGVMQLGTPDGFAMLTAWIKQYDPEVVVIDTVRTAWPGLEENSADAWAPVNKMLLAIRNTGRSVIVVHHANKGGPDGLGREAGNTNQLTNLDVQLRLTPMYEDEQDAARWNGDVDLPDTLGETKTQQLTRKAESMHHGARVRDVYRVEYRKKRDGNENMRDIYIATAERPDGTQFVVSQNSLKQQVRILAARGKTPFEIATHPDIRLSVKTVQEWTA